MAPIDHTASSGTLFSGLIRGLHCRAGARRQLHALDQRMLPVCGWRSFPVLTWLGSMAIESTIMHCVNIWMRHVTWGHLPVRAARTSPPAVFPSRVVDGTVVASGLADGLTHLQNVVRVSDERRNLSSAWERAIKLKIPETGPVRRRDVAAAIGAIGPPPVSYDAETAAPKHRLAACGSIGAGPSSTRVNTGAAHDRSALEN